MSIVAGDRLNHAQEQRLRLIDFLLVHYGGSTSRFFETLRSLTGNEAPIEWTEWRQIRLANWRCSSSAESYEWLSGRSHRGT